MIMRKKDNGEQISVGDLSTFEIAESGKWLRENSDTQLLEMS